MHTHVCMYVCVRVCACVRASVFVFCVCMHICMYACMDGWMDVCVCVYVCRCVCVYVFMRVCSRRPISKLPVYAPAGFWGYLKWHRFSDAPLSTHNHQHATIIAVSQQLSVMHPWQHGRLTMLHTPPTTTSHTTMLLVDTYD